MQRPVPELTELNRTFWTSGANGVLRIQRCRSCERLVHPPALRCPHDYGVLGYVTVSGRARVESWTENHHPWFPGFPPPYIVAFVTPVEDDRVRLLTNLVNVAAGEVTESMAVRVTFEAGSADGEQVYFPLFEPDGRA